jgi:hypothetical protein
MHTWRIAGASVRSNDATSYGGSTIVSDNSLDLFGVKPVAKAVEHASIKTIDGVSAFFAAICMPAAEEFGLMLRDRVAAFRQKNLASIAQKARDTMEHTGVVPTGDTNPRLIHEVIEQGSWAEDDCIQQMWGGLIAAASNTAAAADDSLVYTEDLRRLTPLQARLLNHVYSDPRSCSVRVGDIVDDPLYSPTNSLVYPAREILELYPDDLSKFVNLADTTHQRILDDEDSHLIALGRCRPQIDSLVSLGLFRDARLVNRGHGGMHFLPSLKGLDLYMRGLGYKYYPLETFIAIQQHWCRQKGIDPATHRKT